MKYRWPLTSLSEVLTERTEVPDPADLASGAVRIVSKIGFNDGIIQLRSGGGTRTGMILIRPGDLVLSGINAAKGAIAIYDPNATQLVAATIHYGSYIPKKEKVDVRYLWWLLRSDTFREILKEHLPSGIKTELKAKRLLSVSVPLPAVEEQQLIVARIEKLSAKIGEARKLRRQAMEEAKALLFTALHQFFEVESSEWDHMPMPEAITITDCQVDPNLPEYSQLPHISGENIESKTCKLLPYRTAEEDGVKSGNYLFSPHSILYSKIRPYLQKAVFVDFQGVCSADVYPIKVINEKLEPRFVMWSFVAPPFTEYANRLSGRTRMPKLNRKQLFAFTLAYPKVDKQRRIVAYLDNLHAKVDTLKRIQAQTAAELDALMPSILDKAFKGELV